MGTLSGLGPAPGSGRVRSWLERTLEHLAADDGRLLVSRLVRHHTDQDVVADGDDSDELETSFDQLLRQAAEARADRRDDAGAASSPG